MTAFRFSRLAEADLMDIGAYTLRTWGEDQAISYIDDLESRCQQLADNPELGGVCDHIRLRTPQKRFIGSLSHKRRPAAHGIWQELNASPKRLDL